MGPGTEEAAKKSYIEEGNGFGFTSDGIQEFGVKSVVIVGKVDDSVRIDGLVFTELSQ